MSVIYLVIPLAGLIVLVAVLAYLWAAERGQFDDLVTPSMRVLHDHEPPAHASDVGTERETHD